MSFWKAKTATSRRTVTCTEIVNDFAGYLQDSRRWRDEDGRTVPPYDVEIIKSAIVAEAVRQASSDYDAHAKSAFIWLRDITPGAKKLPELASMADEQMEQSLNREMDALETEFDSRLALARSLANA